MGANGSTLDYSFGQKNNWRRWAWNQAAELVSDKHSGVAIYLPSASDIDRDVAVSKGFKDYNLIGVERNSKAACSARSNGAMVIKGNFWDAVHACARSRVGVSLMFGDFCSGLTHGDEYVCALNACSLPGTKGAAVGFNFMRGRDPRANYIRNIYEKYAGKHRGRLFVYAFTAVIAMGLRENISRHGIAINDLAAWQNRVVRALLPDYPSLDSSPMKCRFASYTSTTGQVFDSCFFINPMTVLWRRLGIDDSTCLGVNLKEQKNNIDLCVKTVASARAVLAHRTMRMSGRFPKRRNCA